MAAIGTSLGGKNSVVRYSAMVFVAVQAEINFMNLLSGKAPTMGDAASRMRGQTNPNTPIVKIMDLNAEAGDKVNIDLFNVPHGKPIMGDKTINGKGMPMTTDTAGIYINQSRGLVGTKGRMSQKRTVHNLREVLRPGLTGWASRVEEQRCFVQLAGARGSATNSYWEIPLQTDPDFNEIMVNPVNAPTYNRRFFASSTATSVANLGTGDILTLGDIERISIMLNESNVPLAPVVFDEDPYGWENPYSICFVTQRQWEYMKAAASPGSAASLWQSALTGAMKRFEGTKPHPLFKGDAILWNNILVKPLSRYAIRFNPGDVITEATNANTFTTTTAAVPSTTNFNVDRAILVGSQALGKAYGNLGTGTGSYFWNEELTDHKARVEVSVAMMEGCDKITFMIDGMATDMGVAVIDSYAPPVNSTQGVSALAVTKR